MEVYIVACVLKPGVNCLLRTLTTCHNYWHF